MAGYRLSSRSLHVHHLPIDHHEHAFYARSGIVVCCQRGVQSETRALTFSPRRGALRSSRKHSGTRREPGLLDPGCLILELASSWGGSILR
jgi:hypothetical protein